jgi:hypothetical protein
MILENSNREMNLQFDKLNNLVSGTCEKMQENILKDLLLRQRVAEQDPLFEYRTALTVEDTMIITNLQFGVNCWHINDHESEAMWKLYGNAVAIKSTNLQLHNSIINPPSTIYTDSVRYRDFVNAPIEKNHRHYSGFIKRLSFGHEKEFRASIKLKTPGQGMDVDCDLETLITGVYISPLSVDFFKEVVESLVEKYRLNKPVHISSLSITPSRRDAIINDPRTYEFIERVETINKSRTKNQGN